ncbi:unnamed protein product [Cladocopium goreaui]|uniref:Uncharacterized protein n=1 Tax=Cladocopium goreaui TaxID=2562237 RepID=A0A9P1DWJ4_9DINO|nr:unnamed protein product [Cladocopium goreaui]|mmetsp:Transcript_63597/g.139379  ORF Transcript_63597/g.139379 Transcript_63597/m.139379 type:complete len:132 (-) Transcript_63597:166-561(-)
MRAARKLKSDRKALPLLADRFSTGSTTASENEQLEDVQLEYMQESQPPKAPPRVNSLPRIEVAGDKDSRPFYRGSLAADLQRLQREALDSTESCEPQPRQVLPRKLPSLHVFGAAEEQAELEGILAAALVK